MYFRYHYVMLTVCFKNSVNKKKNSTTEAVAESMVTSLVFTMVVMPIK